MVFEGGASRTAFSCGVMDAFLEEELMPDYIYRCLGRNLHLACPICQNRRDVT